MDKSIILPTGKVISNNNLFVISEVGNQFAGNMDTTKKLIEATFEAGADCIKFIFWFPDEIMKDMTQTYLYQTKDGTKTENMAEMLQRYTFTFNEWMAVRGLCDEAGLSLMITVNSPSGLTWASQMDLPIYKISSWDYGFNDLWRMIGAEGSPIFIDTGPCYLHELAEGIDIIRRQDNDKIVLMHTFHTHNFSEMNMRTIPYLRDTFDCMVGYCAAGRDNYLDAVAVGVGACALEKRLSMDTGDNVLHSAVSLNPSEFMDYVKTMRGLKEAMGEYKLQPSGGDLIERRKWFRSVVADIGIMKGMNVNRDMLEAKRGENGISPKYIDFLIGRKATRDIERNETIELTDLG